MQEKRRHSLNSVLNVEDSDSLGLKSNCAEVGVSADSGLQLVIVNSLPLDLSVEHLLDVHVSGQRLLLDGKGRLWSGGVGNVGIVPEGGSNLLNVNSIALWLVLRGKVMHILQSDLDLVLAKRSGIELGRINNTGCDDLGREVG